MPFKKGQSGNDKGRTKGVGNKSTEKAKALFMDIMAGNVNKFKTALDYLYKQDKIKWLDVVNKFFPYYLPRQMDITSDNKSINPYSELSDEELINRINKLIKPESKG